MTQYWCLHTIHVISPVHIPFQGPRGRIGDRGPAGLKGQLVSYNTWTNHNSTQDHLLLH